MTNVKQNRAAWNRLAETGSQFASVATDEELQNPLQTLETRGWLPPEVTGLNVLCLAGGGGWQVNLNADIQGPCTCKTLRMGFFTQAPSLALEFACQAND